MHRKTEALIDLEAIRGNYRIACDLTPGSKNIAVIKADAYGHGMVQVANALQSDTPAFAVATLDEALVLRAAGISHPLLVLEGVMTADACEEAAVNSVGLMVNSRLQVARLLAARLASPVTLWLKIDTGMHRLGLQPGDVPGILAQLQEAGIEVAVLSTHLACADDPDSDATQTQLARFASCTAGLDIPRSISNSAGILGWPESHADWNRPGYLLYGDSPMMREVETAAGLQPAMTFRAEIIALREVAPGESVGYGARWTATRPSLIATVAAGYADGYPRHASNGTPTLINGQVAPLAGTVSMDMITVDVTGLEQVAIGDAVELWGKGVSVGDIARRCGTIGYELLTQVTSRVPRVYDA